MFFTLLLYITVPNASSGWQQNFLRQNHFAMRAVTRAKKAMAAVQRGNVFINQRLPFGDQNVSNDKEKRTGVRTDWTWLCVQSWPSTDRVTGFQVQYDWWKGGKCVNLLNLNLSLYRVSCLLQTDVIGDGVGGESDDNSFCTLNLTIPMQPRLDGKNKVKPLLVLAMCGR